MLEIAMVTILAGMGFYFFKSTDLPKELKERSAQNRASNQYEASAPKKFAMAKVNLEEKKIPAEIANLPSIKDNLEAERLIEIKKHERELKIALHNKKIDELTLLITTLESQIRANSIRNAEIQAQINLHLESLKILQSHKIA